VKLSGTSRSYAAIKGIDRIGISISHCEQYAVAVANAMSMWRTHLSTSSSLPKIYTKLGLSGNPLGCRLLTRRIDSDNTASQVPLLKCFALYVAKVACDIMFTDGELIPENLDSIYSISRSTRLKRQTKVDAEGKWCSFFSVSFQLRFIP
jgi:hypothetical protein